MTGVHALQRLTLPRPTTAEPTLYARLQGTTKVVDEGVVLGARSSVTFDTSFGVFAAGRWRRLTSVNDLGVRVRASGVGVAEVVGVVEDRETVVASASLPRGEGSPTSLLLMVPDLQSSPYGSYFVRVVAHDGEVCMTGGEWVTNDDPVRDVRLSLSITTFNRQQYVTATVTNVLNLIAETDSLRDRVRVLVVDNARNISFDAPADAPLQVIENGNLGGAGGFARGLIELRRQKWATHVLFMDDDITLEPEALVRTVSLFAYAKNPKLCVHGAMLSEERPWMQFEAGSEYKFRSIYPLQAIGREDDLRDRSLAIADAPEVPFDYTAWWYTAFPITITDDNPLPVFVRGDDVAFGLMHTGRHSVTLNGVIVWHADFGLKNNPSSLYYEARNMALIDTLVFDRHRWWHLVYRFSSFGFRNLFSMRYASTEYMLKGLNAFLEGPKAWMAIDHSALHDELRACVEEKPGPLPADLAAIPPRRPRPKVLRAFGFLFAVLLGGGTVVPARLRLRGYGVAPIDARAVGVATLRDRVLYRHDRLDEGYVVERDNKRFFALLRETIATMVTVARRYGRLKREYRSAYAEMVSTEAWEDRFSASLRR
jgi:galactofuranosylgalactofuranosylrhamnosyl-N-acetylglucosaminyl-diphospho-decaprenol beta-1,5/1,6-galactofuranosyltransferase